MKKKKVEIKKEVKQVKEIEVKKIDDDKLEKINKAKKRYFELRQMDRNSLIQLIAKYEKL